jgi:hypothetical protein
MSYPPVSTHKRAFILLMDYCNIIRDSIDNIQVVAVGGDNFIFGLTNGGQIFRLYDKGNNKLEWGLFDTGSYRFTDICCARRTLFALGSDHLLYHWDSRAKNMTMFLPNDTQRLHQITAMNNRTVYGLTEDGTVMCIKKNRANSLRRKTSSWTQIGIQKMKNLSVGSKHLLRKVELWGIGHDDLAYRYDHMNGTWILYDIHLKDISVTRDNAVYGVRKRDGRLVKWNGSEQFVLQDLGAPNDNYVLQNVSAYKERREVYSVDSHGNLLKMSYC